MVLPRWLIRSALVVTVALAGLLTWRAVDSLQGPPLQPWHTFVPDELSAPQLDHADWQVWLAAENQAMAQVASQVTAKLDLGQVPRVNRYRQDSIVYPAHFAQDWNRSFELRPAGAPKGVVVLLHGLTDSPFSMRHLAEHYRDAGYLAVAIRMPGHGTVPAGLTHVHWQDWLAATRLAVREARQQVPAPLPLILVGYSNGGALAMTYTLDSLDDASLARPAQVVLLSPMIGVDGYARFAGIAGWPAIFPAFAKSAWLDRLPEFNPFKYNSFPVNAARQSWLLTSHLQKALAAHAKVNGLQGLPPILTFQSLVDYTVSTPAVINRLYRLLPDNGSALVLFDINRASDFGGLLDDSAATSVERLLPATPRPWRTTLITNAASNGPATVAVDTPADRQASTTTPLAASYPRDIFSLSHVAMPFPVTDGLYGTQPAATDRFGIHLGTLAARGERGVLVVPLDVLMRIGCNPFFDYLLQRLDATYR
ncbi:hypothetical protein PMM47T1_14996 [Pseudomonas sp. M47T1]|uniref:alpha/beta hydrolase n=1 Tax=Pseudomonas sp. M47T1 TaxID=1179778 RepID=UPI0002606F46|nr:alpha/beta hydrolase [Pseudomonas sp. M47T1]EIK95703.1 hypothetical protein PMM47T1_14996 [Pseudomonas sp. M47T1]